MGTNYYWIQQSNACCHCGRADEVERHIGKSSGGWCFALHVFLGEGINDLDDWRKLWAQPDSIIRDEYGDVIPIDEMERVVTDRRWVNLHEKDNMWYGKNHAEPGPNGLARHRVESTGTERQSFTNGCVKHGKGTWDCIVGEFS